MRYGCPDRVIVEAHQHPAVIAPRTAQSLFIDFPASNNQPSTILIPNGIANIPSRPSLPVKAYRSYASHQDKKNAAP